jgi:hypothetical protein
VLHGSGAETAPGQYSGRYQNVCLMCCLDVCFISYSDVGWVWCLVVGGVGPATRTLGKEGNAA